MCDKGADYIMFCILIRMKIVHLVKNILCHHEYSRSSRLRKQTFKECFVVPTEPSRIFHTGVCLFLKAKNLKTNFKIYRLHMVGKSSLCLTKLSNF